MENYKMVAKTFFGFEELLEKELVQLGAQQVQKGTRMVSFYGDKGFMYKANLALRTALKILKPIHTFKATHEKGLYAGIQAIDWSTYLSVQQSFVIETTIYSETFTHSQFVSLKVKDAIVAAYGQLRIGNPLDQNNHVGPLIDTHAVELYNKALAQVVAEGGKILVEGGVLTGAGYESGCYVKPAIAEAKNDFAIVQHETFAPVLYLLKYSGDVTEAIEIQNGVAQGLSSAG